MIVDEPQVDAFMDYLERKTETKLAEFIEFVVITAAADDDNDDSISFDFASDLVSRTLGSVRFCSFENSNFIVTPRCLVCI